MACSGTEAVLSSLALGAHSFAVTVTDGNGYSA